jgi:hypothetical protein
MMGNRVVVYFDRQEDALRFALAASSVMSTEGKLSNNTAVNAANEIRKATRITTEGLLKNAR